jgi:hypothetical protein
MTTPIFVFGIQRSGTTWLANQISQHSQITAVQSDDHMGLHESAFYELLYNRYGDLSVKTNYVEFVEIASASDYFQLAGVDREFLYKLWPTTYTEVFRTVMEDFARRQGVNYWLEKTPKHTLLMDFIAKEFPEAVFIAVERNLQDYLASHMMLHRDETQLFNKIERLIFVIRQTLRWVYYNRTIKSFESSNGKTLLMLTYKEMRQDIQGVMTRIANHIGVPFEEIMTQDKYPPNTSYKKSEKRGNVLTANEKKLTELIHSATDFVPFLAIKFGARVVSRLKGRRDLQDWFFQMTRGTHEAETPFDTKNINDKVNNLHKEL